jgi:endonuclease/exonuclease/phosphatase (EEP) superfamily protein YafD
MKIKARLLGELKTIDGKNICLGIARPIFLIVAICTVSAYLGGFHQIFELTTHYRLQYLLGALFTLILYAFSRRRIEVLVCLFCVGLNAIDILPWYLPTANPTNTTPLRVMLSNVLTSNERYNDFLKYVAEEDPSVLVLMEINDTWQKQLEPVRKRLPYFLEIPDSDNFGIALYSKFPLSNALGQYWAEERYAPASITANITVDGKPLTLIATHPLPPLKPDYFNQRNAHMVEMADFVTKQKNPAIVLGDLNMSLWSPNFRRFLKSTQMRSNRQGFGIQPSWPVDIPLLRIPIDHCLVSSRIAVKTSHIGKDIGSDHYPVVVDLSI